MGEPSERADWTDAGHGVRFKFWTIAGEARPLGMNYEHPPPGKDGASCVGSISFPNGDGGDWDRESWTVESLTPLTLSPSLACRRCGHHGFFRDGRWVPA